MCVYALRIVSTDKNLHFVNTLYYYYSLLFFFFFFKHPNASEICFNIFMTIHNIQGYFSARKRFPISKPFFFFYEGVKMPAATGGDIYDFYINESHYLCYACCKCCLSTGTMNNEPYRTAVCIEVYCTALPCIHLHSSLSVLHCTLIAL